MKCSVSVLSSTSSNAYLFLLRGTYYCMNVSFETRMLLFLFVHDVKHGEKVMVKYTGAMAPGEGRQVVRVTSDHTYSLVEEALRDILLRDDVKDLPVVVVSIAGAYRTGKSFILDFFLRYLLAPPARRENGEWIGGAKEPLKGFKWRLGTEKETTGINLWSNPISVTLESGETVVVLLMDTQGTHDSENTNRDCSTIFALSTLISSVQIYNLRGNIQKDDLQNLQYFARYGELARGEGEGGKAFQELKFLVRDWQNSSEYAFGAEGGSKFLSKLLKITDKQNEELKSLREQNFKTFEKLTCFLMPHPGFSIENPDFSGCITDLRQEFRMALLELVPSIFRTSNLTPKIINGDKVTAKALFKYFKTYMKIFNSKELPEPTTILKVTSETGLVLDARLAREEYEAQMQQHCGADRHAPSVTPAALHALHRAALTAALNKFNNKKKMASKEHCDTYLAQLTQELEDCRSRFITSNNAKIWAAVTKAKEAYEAKLTEVRGLMQLCLHPEDLKDFHKTNVDAILSEFDLTRRVIAGEVDNERIALVQHFGDRLEELLHTNEENNSAAVRLSREAYITGMERSFEDRSCVTADLLARNHARLYNVAIKSFMDRRNRPSEHALDNYKDQLINELEDCRSRFITSNNAKIWAAVTKAKEAYEAKLTEMRGLMQLCLHPEDLKDFHKTNVDAILSEFDLTRRIMAGEVDNERIALVQHFGDRLEELLRMNEENNSAAVRLSREAYITGMERSFEDRSCVTADLLARNHARLYNVAIKTFMDRRNRPSEHALDNYKDDLINSINSDYSKLKLSNESRSCALVLKIMNTYNSSMAAVSGMFCLHPVKLFQDHMEAKAQALKSFNADQLTDRDDDDDDDNTFLIKLLMELEERYQKLCTQNKANNNMAVDAAEYVYYREMEVKCRPSIYSLLVLPLVEKIICWLPSYHKQCTNKALDVFWSRRRSKEQYEEDIYLKQLHEKLDEGFGKYCKPVQAAAREFGITLPPPYSNDTSSVLANHN